MFFSNIKINQFLELLGRIGTKTWVKSKYFLPFIHSDIGIFLFEHIWVEKHDFSFKTELNCQDSVTTVVPMQTHLSGIHRMANMRGHHKKFCV